MQSARAACGHAAEAVRLGSRFAPTSTGTACTRRCGRVEADDRQRHEQLCRYIARPALSEERVQTNGKLGPSLKSAAMRPTTPI
jgi:hypothetical protein